MASANSTAANDNLTPARLAEKFPLNGDSFAVWYYVSDDGQSGNWEVNNKDCEAVYEAHSYKEAVALSNALIYKNKDIITDIWMIHAQTIVTLAAVNCLDEIDGVEASDELPAIRAMLRDIKAKLELLACREDSNAREIGVQYA